MLRLDINLVFTIINLLIWYAIIRIFLFKPINKVIDKLIYLVINRRHTVYYITIVLVIAGIFGITLMKTTGYMVDDLKETDPIRQDLSFFESNFDGLMPLEVTLDFGTRYSN